ncbi:hypothetical protein C1H46_036969 [Malus baccata]|uniref:Uncharacterized protein n=1 Tax=Malus baccata TaxID=106549 RepID=A0A540KTF4_MALBA|nr:hypothetical protein C1H46_036969 [Malus baccata]
MDRRCQIWKWVELGYGSEGEVGQVWRDQRTKESEVENGGVRVDVRGVKEGRKGRKLETDTDEAKDDKTDKADKTKTINNKPQENTTQLSSSDSSASCMDQHLQSWNRKNMAGERRGVQLMAKRSTGRIRVE